MNMRRLGRFVVQVMLFAVVGLGLALSPASAQEKKTLRISIIPIVDVGPLFAAIQQGYFAEVGLEIDTAPVAGGAAGVPGLIAGAYDVVFTNVVSTALARSQGLPVKIIAPASANGPEPPEGAALLVRKGEGLKSGADFEGKSIAVNTQNNIIWLYVRAWVKKTGGDPSKVTFREVPFPQMLDALRGKQVDGVFVVDPFRTAGQRDPELEQIAWPYHAVQPGASIAQYIVTERFLADNPETVRRFTAALHKGIEWANEHIGTPELNKLIASYTRMTPERIAGMSFRTWPTTVDVDSISKTIELMREHELLKGEVKAEELVLGNTR